MEELLREWYPLLKEELDKPYFKNLMERVSSEERKLCPAPEDVFNAFSLSPSKVKVIILGQDPYINGEAHGYSFSSKLNKVPPSLQVIHRELARVGVFRSNPSLLGWSDQGVLLLNRILTTVSGISRAHGTFGWQKFTGTMLYELSKINTPKVFMLWGNDAKEAMEFIIQNGNNLVLTSPHPAAERYASVSSTKKFVGNNHFITANEFLKSFGVEPIDWSK